MVLQIVRHTRRVHSVFVMNKVIVSSETVPARRAELKEKGGELIGFLS